MSTGRHEKEKLTRGEGDVKKGGGDFPAVERVLEKRRLLTTSRGGGVGRCDVGDQRKDPPGNEKAVRCIQPREKASNGKCVNLTSAKIGK